MPDLLRVARFPLPDEWEVEETICVRFRIPDDPQYLAALTGLLELLKWSKSFARDDSGIGAATVSRTWQAALESEPITIESCDMPEFRINPETCLLEVDCGDENWQPVVTVGGYDPSQDEPVTPPYPDPPPLGQSNQCLAAANTSAFIENGSGNFAAVLGTGGVIGTLVGVLYTFLSSVITVTLSQLWLGLGVAYGAFNSTTIEDDYAAFDWQELTDLLECYYEDDGTMTAANWATVLDLMQDRVIDTGNQIWLLIAMVWGLMGTVGAAYAALWAGITEAECAGCGGWSHEFDFTIDQQGWTIVPNAYDPNPACESEDLGTYVATEGFKPLLDSHGGAGSEYQVYIQIPFDSRTVQLVGMEWEGGCTYARAYIDQCNMLEASTFPASPLMLDIDDTYLSSIIVGFLCADDTPRLTKVTLYGIGTDPF